MTKASIDFVIVGAQKSGTTSLHEVLSRHPQIAMPSSKEVPVFNTRHADPNLLSMHLATLFPDRGRSAVIKGKASPQYLPSRLACEQIHQVNPNTRIIAILRDPVERAYSHYRMLIRRGQTNLSFPDLVSVLLSGNAPEAPTGPTLPADSFEVPYILAWSEYGRMLAPYIDRFTAQQVLVLKAENLERNPQATYEAILRFLGVDTTWKHPSMGQKFHRGGESPIIDFKRLRRVPVLGATLKAMFTFLPERVKYLINTRNIKVSNASARESFPKVAEILDEYFKQDQMLVRLIFEAQIAR